MTKAELINYIAKDCRISKSLAEQVLNSVTHNVSKCMRKNDKITLTGFGTFYVQAPRAHGAQPADGRRDQHQGSQGSAL